ncbi:MAG: TVP38/TMEM64 family protein, partial [Halorhabdus sp.]
AATGDADRDAVRLDRHYRALLVDHVERAIDPDTLGTFDGFVSRNGRFSLFLVFLVPGLPDDSICVLAGLTRIPVRQLVVISLLGRAPGYMLMSYAGTQFASTNYFETTLVLSVLAFASMLVYWQKDTVLAAFETT